MRATYKARSSALLSASPVLPLDLSSLESDTYSPPLLPLRLMDGHAGDAGSRVQSDGEGMKALLLRGLARCRERPQLPRASERAKSGSELLDCVGTSLRCGHAERLKDRSQGGIALGPHNVRIETEQGHGLLREDRRSTEVRPDHFIEEQDDRGVGLVVDPTERQWQDASLRFPQHLPLRGQHRVDVCSRDGRHCDASPVPKVVRQRPHLGGCEAERVRYRERLVSVRLHEFGNQLGLCTAELVERLPGVADKSGRDAGLTGKRDQRDIEVVGVEDLVEIKEFVVVRRYSSSTGRSLSLRKTARRTPRISS